jgi:hypothetical protein
MEKEERKPFRNALDKEGGKKFLRRCLTSLDFKFQLDALIL